MMSLNQAPVAAEDVRTHTRRDPIMSKVLKMVKTGWPMDYRSTPSIQPFYQRRTELSFEEDCILWGSRVIIPPALRNQVLEELHEANNRIY